MPSSGPGRATLRRKDSPKAKKGKKNQPPPETRTPSTSFPPTPSGSRDEPQSLIQQQQQFIRRVSVLGDESSAGCPTEVFLNIKILKNKVLSTN